ncbi:MAG: CocE/NonD family hydrolase [Rhodospirillales bacterium]|jgi:uncharacterized protein|nr:CocE/NonD family hydrolase [Rhodospirillales bacterium]
MQTVGQFPHVVQETENEWITLGDGCRLAARMWMPEGAETSPVPAILEYLPYRKRDGTATRDELTHPYLAGHGYACIRVDMRGSGESDGLMFDEYVKQEQDDALEVIDWLTSQPWCDGNVGMIGISWGGFNGLQVAARKPKALKAVITICSTDDRYADDIHYKGGCLLGENMGWGATMLAFSSRPPDPELVGERWRKMWMERLENEPLLAATWLKHQHRDDYWKHGSVCEDYSDIEAAVLAVGGWGDAYSNTVARLLSGLKSPARGIVGPWHHKYPHFAVPEPRIGFLQEALRWWDHWLKGIDTGVMEDPLYRAYMMESVRPKTFYPHRDGRWISEKNWPSENIEDTTLSLNASGLDIVQEGEEIQSICSPQNTGEQSGEFCVIWLGPDMPDDQQEEDARSLIFDGQILQQRTEIFGATVLDLEFISDKPQANVAVRLCDVAPDGSSTRVSWTVFNLCHRDSHEFPQDLKPGQKYKARIQLDDIAYAFPQGNRIRLAISTAYWPMIWPSPEAVTLNVSSSSKLHLPLRAVREDTVRPFEPAEAAPPRKVEVAREGSQTRSQEMDEATGESVLRIHDDFGDEFDTDTGLTSGEIARELYRIHPDDPLSARAEIHWTEILKREGWDIRTETFSALKADKTTFYVTGRIEAYENNDLIYEQNFKEEIPRCQV